ADDDFTLAIGPEWPAQFVENCDICPGRYTDGTGLAHSGRQRIAGNLVGGLRHAVGFQNWHVELSLQVTEDRPRQRSRTGSNETQRMALQHVGMLRGVGGDRGVHDRYSRVPTGLKFL